MTKNPRLDGMVRIPRGTFLMGSDRHYPEEAPAHEVTVDELWMDAHPVTNAQFAKFVAATGYVTLAERPADPDMYPGANPELLVPSSVVFDPPDGPVDMRNPYNWWKYVAGADWRHRRGPGTSIAGLDDHPVVHVAYQDADAYAVWARKKLPTEAEWELAARGGIDGADYSWGDELPAGKPMANTWQGAFPFENLVEDGYEWTSPVGAYPANGYGLYDMIGNVWEWTTDFYEEHHRHRGPCCSHVNPQHGTPEGSCDPRAPIAIPRRVMKGGSFLCAKNYCRRDRPAARMAQAVDTSTCHLGFRCVFRLAT